MSDRLVNGGEVLTAVEASAQRAEDIGYDEALVELGFDPNQLRYACIREAKDWVQKMPVGATVGEIVDLVASAELVGVTAGVRLGRMYGSPTAPEPFNGDAVERLASVASSMRTLAAAYPGQTFALRLTELAERAEAIVREGRNG